MQEVRWLTFGLTSSLTKTLVHFFPSSGNVTAPYPANCRVTLFGQDLVERSVLLEGARLGQPDGVRVDDLFPELEEKRQVLFGLEVQLSCSQPKIQLTGSGCVVEFSSTAGNVKFLPRNIADENGLPLNQEHLGLLLEDDSSEPVVVFVNRGPGEFKPVMRERQSNSGATPAAQLTSLTLPAGSVIEVSSKSLFQGIAFEEQDKFECSSGQVSTRPIQFEDSWPKSVAAYLIYRDRENRRPQSVFSI